MDQSVPSQLCNLIKCQANKPVCAHKLKLITDVFLKDVFEHYKNIRKIN